MQRCTEADRNYGIVKNLATWADKSRPKDQRVGSGMAVDAATGLLSVITGATKAEHVLSNVDGGKWALTAEGVRRSERHSKCR